MLKGSWIGNLNGTLVGNLFVEFYLVDGTEKVTLRANVNNQPIVLVGNVETVEGNTTAKLSPNDETLGDELNTNLVFDTISDNRLSGRWFLKNGHAGSFVIGPATNIPTPATDSGQAQKSALKIVRRTVSLPKITIYRDEIKKLTLHMKELLDTPFQVVIHAGTFSAGQSKKDIRKFASDFWDDPSLSKHAEFLNLSLSEPGELPRSIDVNLGTVDCSVSVTGADDVWVSGCSHELEQFFSNKNSRWRNFYENHALNFNGIAFLIALTLLPSLELIPRIFLMASTLTLILLFKAFHGLTTSLRIFLLQDQTETNWLDLPRILNTLLGAGFVASVPAAYAWLSNNGLQNLLDWLSKIANQP